MSPQVLVAEDTLNSQQFPAVATVGNDSWVVWQTSGVDADGASIAARKFGFNGGYLTSELQVNEFSVGDQVGPDIAVGATGDVFLSWLSDGQDGDSNGHVSGRGDSMVAYAATPGRNAPNTRCFVPVVDRSRARLRVRDELHSDACHSKIRSS